MDGLSVEITLRQLSNLTVIHHFNFFFYPKAVSDVNLNSGSLGMAVCQFL